MKRQGLIVLENYKDLKRANTIFLLSYRLRLVRTSLGDNGFSGVRTLTSNDQFLRDLQAEAELSKEAANAEAGCDLPDLEGIGGVDMGTFAKLEPGNYMTVSPGSRLKYLVCNPDHQWAAALMDDIVWLCPVDQKQVKDLKGDSTRIVKTSFASFV
jgi:hypothetical protein